MTQRRETSARLRGLQLLGVLLVVAAGLWGWNAWRFSQDRRLALGASSAEQRAFFIAASERPDIGVFYKGLTSEERVKMARQIGEHDAPELAKLLTTLLATLDSEARRALTDSMVKLAPRQTEAVAEQLTQGGGFQRGAVFAALKAVGPSALPAIASQLEVADARANTISLMVEMGPEAIPFARQALASVEHETRVAAADVLGKLRAREAVSDLLRVYEQSDPDERVPFLAALASIADPVTRDLLVELAFEPSSRDDLRLVAVVGLGRIGDPRDWERLWRLADSSDFDLASAAVEALRLASPAALVGARLSNSTLRVVAGVPGEAGDQWVRRGLAASDPNIRFAALEAAEGRESLAPEVAAWLAMRDPREDGEEFDRGFRVLATTVVGRRALEDWTADRYVGGLATRRLAQVRE